MTSHHPAGGRERFPPVGSPMHDQPWESSWLSRPFYVEALPPGLMITSVTFLTSCKNV